VLNKQKQLIPDQQSHSWSPQDYWPSPSFNSSRETTNTEQYKNKTKKNLSFGFLVTRLYVNSIRKKKRNGVKGHSMRLCTSQEKGQRLRNRERERETAVIIRLRLPSSALYLSPFICVYVHVFFFYRKFYVNYWYPISTIWIYLYKNQDRYKENK
jgi:hypothetical protein